MSGNNVNSEKAAPYLVTTVQDQEVIDKAIGVINKRFERGETLTNPAETMRYVKILTGWKEHEVFGVLMLDNRNRAIKWREMFKGTIDGASVYPREVVKQALADNAAAVILAHNHPSGIAEPSQADIQITERLKKALALVDIRVLDHIIVGEDVMCFSERGLI